MDFSKSAKMALLVASVAAQLGMSTEAVAETLQSMDPTNTLAACVNQSSLERVTDLSGEAHELMGCGIPL